MKSHEGLFRFLPTWMYALVGLGLNPLFISVVISAGVAFVAWGPIRWWLFSYIPVDAAMGWLVKLLIIILIGWGGGIALPIVIIVFGFMVNNASHFPGRSRF